MAWLLYIVADDLKKGRKARKFVGVYRLEITG
jgi:hypothetical protein